MALLGRILLFLILALIPLGGVGFGGYTAWWQDRMIQTWTPVKAEVLQVAIETHRGSKGKISYEPVVHYHYTVKGQDYRGSDIFPFFDKGSYDFAQDTVALFPLGSTTTAYVNPDDPAEAFLLKVYSFWPYFFILSGCLIGAIFLLIRWPSFGSRAAPASGAGPWYILSPEVSLNQRVSKPWLAAIISFAGCAAAIHYFSVADHPETLAWITTSVYAAFFLVVLGMLLHAWLLSRAVRDAEVELDRPVARPGGPLRVRVTLPLRRQAIAGTLRAWVVHTQTTTTGSGKHKSVKVDELLTLASDEASLASAGGFAATNAVTIELDAGIPPEATPTSIKPSTNPRYDWFVRIHADIPGAPDYKAKFHLLVIDPQA